MNTLFVIYDSPASLSDADAAMLAEFLPLVPGLSTGLILTPERQDGANPFAADGRGPALVLQLGFRNPADRDAALHGSGALAPLARPDALPSLAGAEIRHQAMTATAFPVPEPRRSHEGALTFFVTYPGTTADLESWLDHYDANHPPIMRRFPGVRAVETYRPVPWESELPWARDDAMQRNKVVFDDLAALVAALTSPVMAEMRADAATFPPFSPKATHFPMITRELRGR
jgi:uncharacterized protein (TIGR02118 family)